jgi:hypothetical protein
MRVYYGISGALGSRVGRRSKRLDVRQRLTRTVAEMLETRCPDWRQLPAGQTDLALLRSIGVEGLARPPRRWGTDWDAGGWRV